MCTKPLPSSAREVTALIQGTWLLKKNAKLIFNYFIKRNKKLNLFKHLLLGISY